MKHPNSTARVQLIRDLQGVFLDKGWQIRAHAKEGFSRFWREDTGKLLTTGLDENALQPMPDHTEFQCVVGLSLPEVNQIAAKIQHGSPTPCDETILSNVKAAHPLLETQAENLDLFSHVCQEVISKAAQVELEEAVKEFAAPWSTHLQISHLAALAYTGDFNTLMDYQILFKGPNRANFHPYIAAAMIDRAFDIAVDRAE